jgi:tetratricopeptide (TPR) repeat protein
MKPATLVLATMFLGIAPIAAIVVARADAPADCAQLQELPKTIAACTTYIDSGAGDAHDRAVAHFHRGTALGIGGQLDGALPDLDKAIDLDPNWSPPYINRARVNMGKGEAARAIPDYDKAVALHPDDATGYLNRALAYLKLQDSDHALADLEKVVALNPAHPFATFNIGAIYEAKGDQQQAGAAYKKALSLVPGNQTIIDSLKRLGIEP